MPLEGHAPLAFGYILPNGRLSSVIINALIKKILIPSLYMCAYVDICVDIQYVCIIISFYLFLLMPCNCCHKLSSFVLLPVISSLLYHCTNASIMRKLLATDNLQATWNSSLLSEETTDHHRHDPFVETSLSLHWANSQLAIMETDCEDVCDCFLWMR